MSPTCMSIQSDLDRRRVFSLNGRPAFSRGPRTVWFVIQNKIGSAPAMLGKSWFTDQAEALTSLRACEDHSGMRRHSTFELAECSVALERHADGSCGFRFVRPDDAPAQLTPAYRTLEHWWVREALQAANFMGETLVKFMAMQTAGEAAARAIREQSARREPDTDRGRIYRNEGMWAAAWVFHRALETGLRFLLLADGIDSGPVEQSRKLNAPWHRLPEPRRHAIERVYRAVCAEAGEDVSHAFPTFAHRVDDYSLGQGAYRQMEGGAYSHWLWAAEPSAVDLERMARCLLRHVREDDCLNVLLSEAGLASQPEDALPPPFA